jgi:acyl-coenzyme A thioesterase PaaI-like protein
MKLKVIKKQKTSRMCMVCGQENKFSLKASFYELENEEVVALFRPLQEHQSYPGRMHGGIAGAILDETIGRAIFIKDENTWGVTAELNLKFHKPIPLDEELKVVARITMDSRRIYEGKGEILLPNGDIAISASGKYVKIALDKITEIRDENEIWETILSDNDPTEIEI